MNNLNIAFDKTPTGNNKYDNSPNNITIPGLKTPMNQFVFRQEDDGSKGYQGMMQGDDFGSKFMLWSRPCGNTPMNQMRNFGDDEGDVSKNFGNTSKAMAGDFSYRKKENNSPIKRVFRYEYTPNNADKGLNFEQAAYTADGVCPCCKQTLPQDRRNINWNYDKNTLMVPQNRGGMMSPSTGNFPNNESADPVTPNPPSKSTIKTEETKKGKKNKRRRKNKAQVKKLEEEFAKNPHWSNEDVEKISRDLKLDKSQVYKWNWDQKKKLNILPSKVYVVQVPDGVAQGNLKGKSDETGRQVYVKSIQDVIKLQSLANTKVIQPKK